MTDLGVDFSADLKLELGKLGKNIERLGAHALRARELDRARQPFSARIQASAVCPSPSVNFGLNFGGPDAGFYWVVRRLVVGGLTWSTTAAGTAEIYVTGLAGAAGTSTSGAGSIAAIRSLSDLVDESAALPNKAFYGSEELIVQPNESLVAVVVGGTASQQYVAAAGIQVVRLTTSLEAEMQV